MKLPFSLRSLFCYCYCILLISNCTYTEKIRDGNTAFHRNQYQLATTFFEKEYAKTDSKIQKGKIAYQLGLSYNAANKHANAAPWFKLAYDNQFGSDALREYAFALKREQKYDEAAEAFKNLGIEIGSPYEYRKEIAACTQAKTWVVDAQKFTPFSIKPFAANTADNEYAVTLFGKEELLFASDRTTASGEAKYNWTGNKFSDFYKIKSATNTAPIPFETFNTPDNEGTCTFTNKDTEIVFSRCFNDARIADKYCQLLHSRFDGTNWTTPTVLPFVREGVNYAQPAFSADGNTLYFSTDDNTGWGGYDIFQVSRNGSGWGEPTPLGRSINSPKNEQFPVVENDTLYFASDGWGGMGGLDMYRTYKLNSSTWSPPQNLKPPLNSGSDDFGLVIENRLPTNDTSILQTGYFASNRSGNDDLYSFTKSNKKPPIPIVKIPTNINYQIILDVYVLEKIYQTADNPNSKVIGRKPLNNATVTINENNKKSLLNTDDQGVITLTLTENTSYSFEGILEGYLRNKATFSTIGIGKDPENPVQRFEIELVLDKIFKNQEIILENIYYDYDKWDIRPDARPTLNTLINMLNQNPSVKIQLSSHTDCRGNENYNEVLSQKRAQAAVDYLIDKGIAPDRLTAKGYGESSPTVLCSCAACTEAEHQANRRTTFKIIE